MAQLFIDQVRAIVLNNLSKEKFGASELASELGLSASQTLRKVKAATGKSANRYIRELRLEQAAKLIKKTDTSIAEIGYQVGFSSSTYFNKTFKKYYGIAPGEYKTKSADLKNNEVRENHLNSSKRFWSISKIFVAAFAVLIAVVGYTLINKSSKKQKSLPNSIAVLPFKDLSPEDTQWFSDGVSDNILHSLAQMKDVSVTSFTSSASYRKTDKQIPQIAEELGVSYVLEGSVTLVNDEIKILAQLIDKNDQHVWSKEYNDNFDNVISIQNNVAQEVIKQLKSTLNPEEKTILEEYPTDNMEAYHLHLEGRLINQSRKWEDLQRNINNNKRAIALDSSFAEAYAQVAATKMKIAIDYLMRPNDKTVKEALNYVDKALSIDPNSAKANAVKGRLLTGNDWGKSETYFKKALAINSNDAEAHYWYADYLLKRDNANIKLALKHATSAIKLSPFSSAIATKYAWVLILNKKYNEADLFLEEYGFLMASDDMSWLKTILLGFKNKSWLAAKEFHERLIYENPENSAFSNFVLAEGYEYGAFEDIGKDIIKSIAYRKKAYELDSNYFWFYLESLTQYGFLNEREQAMKTDIFKNLPNSLIEINKWQYYYYKQDYKQAYHLIEKDSGSGSYSFDMRSRTFAQLGLREKLNSLNSQYPVNGEFKYLYKAYAYAILEERDSMYYHLNKAKYSFRNAIPIINSAPEFEPYKNDKRFKALLKEWFIPISGG